MFDLLVSNPYLPMWSEAAKSRVKAALAFLPLDFNSVAISLEPVSRGDDRSCEYLCKVNAQESAGPCHVVHCRDADAYIALEHAVHMTCRSALEKHLHRPAATPLQRSDLSGSGGMRSW